MSTVQLISAMVAGYAAIVATIALFWNINKEKSSLELRVDGWGEQDRFIDGETISEYQIEIAIINSSYKEAVIKRIGFDYGRMGAYCDLGTPTGKEIGLKEVMSPGDRQIWTVSAQKLVRNGLSLKYLYVEDGRYKRYKARIPKHIVDGCLNKQNKINSQ